MMLPGSAANASIPAHEDVPYSVVVAVDFFIPTENPKRQSAAGAYESVPLAGGATMAAISRQLVVLV